ncbi:hypothetical protein QYF36_025865 [Acer negundo]|nr:hypothetical protein QYF36_025865 [Acer negundo]
MHACHLYTLLFPVRRRIKQNGRLDDGFFRTKGLAYSLEELIEKWDDRIEDVLDGDDAVNFFDSDAFEIDDDLLNEDQKHYKNIIQEVLKWQYFKDRAEREAMFAAAKEAYEKLKAAWEIDVAVSNSGKVMFYSFTLFLTYEQAAKEAAAAAAKEAYEDLNVVEEIDVATSNSGKERKQKRAAEAGYSASDESASETTLRMLAKKVASENNTKGRESESHSDNKGNIRGQESQDTFEIGEWELEDYFDNGGSVRRRGTWKPNGIRGIRKPNGLRKCSQKLSS